jgi:hypothetical protein
VVVGGGGGRREKSVRQFSSESIVRRNRPLRRRRGVSWRKIETYQRYWSRYHELRELFKGERRVRKRRGKKKESGRTDELDGGVGDGTKGGSVTDDENAHHREHRSDPLGRVVLTVEELSAS